VGDSGKIATSSNGTTWTQIFPASSFGSSGIRAVVAKQEYYLAAGSAGKLATSLNTLLWTQRNSLFDITNINGLYADDGFAIAVGNSGKIGYSG
jgi:hypothetical protein